MIGHSVVVYVGLLITLFVSYHGHSIVSIGPLITLFVSYHGVKGNRGHGDFAAGRPHGQPHPVRLQSRHNHRQVGRSTPDRFSDMAAFL